MNTNFKEEILSICEEYKNGTREFLFDNIVKYNEDFYLEFVCDVENDELGWTLCSSIPNHILFQGHRLYFCSDVDEMINHIDVVISTVKGIVEWTYQHLSQETER